MPRPGTKQSSVFGKIPDLDWDRGVWSGPDRVPIGLGPNFPNTSTGTMPPFNASQCVSMCPAPSQHATAIPDASHMPLTRPSPSHGPMTTQDVPHSSGHTLVYIQLKFLMN